MNVGTGSALTTAEVDMEGLSTAPQIDAAFAELLVYDKRLYNLAFRVLRDREDALDAVQNTYLNAYKGFHNYRGESQPYTWLCRIALNECARRGGARTKRRLREVSLALLEEVGSEPQSIDATFAEIDRSSHSKTIRAAVDNLPSLHREAVVLRHYEHRSYAEIASLTACALGTVKSRLSRAHKQLKGVLDPELLQVFA